MVIKVSLTGLTSEADALKCLNEAGVKDFKAVVVNNKGEEVEVEVDFADSEAAQEAVNRLEGFELDGNAVKARLVTAAAVDEVVQDDNDDDDDDERQQGLQDEDKKR